MRCIGVIDLRRYVAALSALLEGYKLLSIQAKNVPLHGVYPNPMKAGAWVAMCDGIVCEASVPADAVHKLSALLLGYDVVREEGTSSSDAFLAHVRRVQAEAGPAYADFCKQIDVIFGREVARVS